MPERIKVSENFQILISIILGASGGIISRWIFTKLKSKKKEK